MRTRKHLASFFDYRRSSCRDAEIRPSDLQGPHNFLNRRARNTKPQQLLNLPLQTYRNTEFIPNPDFLDGLSPADADSAVFICRTRYLYRRQQALPHCQAEALQNDQVLRPPPMLRDESTHASQETAPQSVRPRRTPLYVGGARCRSCMDSVSICMVKSPCSNTFYPPRSSASLKLVEPESILSASEQLPNLLSSV